ncbi:MAG: hypothetical protein WC839_01720 [Candidatus Paceibacterota bacterium]
MADEKKLLSLTHILWGFVNKKKEKIMCCEKNKMDFAYSEETMYRLATGQTKSQPTPEKEEGKNLLHCPGYSPEQCAIKINSNGLPICWNHLPSAMCRG